MTQDVQGYPEAHGRNGHSKAVFAGVVLGGLTGAITALLFAPRSGKETRAQIQSKVSDARALAGEKLDTTVEQVRTRAQDIKVGVGSKAQELKQRGQDVLVGQLDRVSAAAEAGKKNLQASRN